MNSNIPEPMQIEEPDKGSSYGRPFPEFFEKPLEIQSPSIKNINSKKKDKRN